MKLGKKYRYFEKCSKPLRKNYNSEEDFLISNACFEVNQNLGFFWATPINTPLKTWRKRYKNTELKPGNKVNVCRWDWNGIDEIVDITEIREAESFITVICKQGYFIFDGESEPHFNWNRSKSKWYKEYMTRIDPKRYYYGTN